MGKLKDWERQEWDTEKSWEAFQLYLHMSTPRNMSKLCRETHLAEHSVREWSANGAWVERVAAYDRHLAKIQTRAAESEVAKRARRHVRAAQLVEELGTTEIRKTLKRARALDLEAVPARQAAKLVETGIKLQRLVSGEVTERVGEELDYSKFTDEELETFRALVAKAKGGASQ